MGQAIRVDVHMKVGTTTQHMTVEADVTHINTLTASLGEVVENNEIENLPLNGREFMALTTLVPGAVEGGKRGRTAAEATLLGSTALGRTIIHTILTAGKIRIPTKTNLSLLLLSMLSKSLRSKPIFTRLVTDKQWAG